MKKGIIISGGEFFSDFKIGNNDFVIACDKGYEYAKKLGISANIVLGDFDSYEGKLEKNFIKYPSDKNDTDTMIALKTLIENGYKEIDIYCGLGYRLDHLYANISALAYAAKRGVRAKLIDKNTLINVIYNEEISIPKRSGCSLSIFSLSDTSKGVSITGAKYCLNDAKLKNDYPLGVSNEWDEEEIRISVSDGTLLVISSSII